MPISFNHILFIDIETVSQQPDFNLLQKEWQDLWQHKAKTLQKINEQETAESLYQRAAIYAEFGKVVCISCGVIQEVEGIKKLLIKSFYGQDEKELLQQFVTMLNNWATTNQKILCAHNGKEFDFPYLCRRLTIHGIALPALLQIAGKKPWEINHLDTLEMWRFGDYKSYTSLNLLACTLNIPTPKDDIDGSMVGNIYWVEKDLERIVTYCQKDVITLVQILLRMQNQPLIADENIEIKKSV